MYSNNVKQILVEWLGKDYRLVIIGIGNLLKNDDGLGVIIVKELQGKTSDNILLIDCGTVPETYVGPIRKFNPSHVLMIDAAEISSEPGKVRFVFPDEIQGLTISTHTLPLNVFTDYLKKETNAKVALLAVQPKNLDFGENLSSEVLDTVKSLSDTILDVIRNQ
ncbi:hydrogenase maturation peptidase HycI [[Eubacterium] cellulosolvens]